MTTAVDGPTAVTTSGSVRGKVRDRVNVFRGIPFAAPPVGALRFRPPAQPIPWNGVLDATHAGPVAPQLPSALEKMLGAPPPRWDEAQCLTLNVTTPALDGAKRPVMFWIHGGAFVNGAGSSPVYDGTKFAQHGDVVVVTVNYRLGAFGFLHLDEVFGADFAGSGNAGILDQVAALEWVRDNIEAFGGDPDHVTIFGESAGGMSVGTLLGLPRAEGLYHRAIVQSGSSSFALPSGRATTTAREVLALAGVTTVEELESVPAEQILTAQAELLKRGADVDLPFQPVIDGAVVPELPLQTIASGATGNVATMVGTTADEMTLFLALELGAGSIDAAALRRQMEKLFGDGAAAVIDTYRANRADGSPGDLLTAISTDRVFRIPAIRLAEAQARQARPTFMYLFTWATPVMDGKLKSCHTLELPFVWDGVDAAGLGMLTGDGPERQGIADAMHAAWIAFAAHRRPRVARLRPRPPRDEALRHLDRDPGRPAGRRARPLGRGRPTLTRSSRRAEAPLRCSSGGGRGWGRLLDDGAAVDGEGVTNDEAGCVRAQPDDARGDLFGPSEPAHRHRVAHHLLDLLVAPHEAFEHWRPRAAGADAVDPDPLRGVLERARPGEADHAVLARDVRRQPGEADETGTRRDVHDRPVALTQHHGDLVAQAVEDAVEVERDRAVPVVHVVVRGEPTLARCPRVVHCVIEPAERRDRRRDHRGHLSRVRHVRPHEHRLDPARGDEIDGPLSAHLVDVRDQDVRATLGECDCGRPTEP